MDVMEDGGWRMGDGGWTMEERCLIKLSDESRSGNGALAMEGRSEGTQAVKKLKRAEQR